MVYFSDAFIRLVRRPASYIAKNSRAIEYASGDLVKIPAGLNITRVLPKGGGLVNVLLKSGQWVVGVVFDKLFSALKTGLSALKSVLGSAYEATAEALAKTAERLRTIKFNRASKAAGKRSGDIMEIEKAVDLRYANKLAKKADEDALRTMAKSSDSAASEAGSAARSAAKKLANDETIKDAQEVLEKLKKATKEGKRVLDTTSKSKFTTLIKYGAILGGLSTYIGIMAKQHSENMSGCFRTAPNGGTCKVIAYTVGGSDRKHTGSDPICLQFEPPYSGEPWTKYVSKENNGTCYSVCNNDMLDLKSSVQMPLTRPSATHYKDDLLDDVKALGHLNKIKDTLKSEGGSPTAPAAPAPPGKAETGGAETECKEDIAECIKVKPGDTNGPSQVAKNDEELNRDPTYTKLENMMSESLPYYSCTNMSFLGALSDLANRGEKEGREILAGIGSGLKAVVHVMPTVLKYGIMGLGAFAVLAGGIKLISWARSGSGGGGGGGGSITHHFYDRYTSRKRRRRHYDDDYEEEESDEESRRNEKKKKTSLLATGGSLLWNNRGKVLPFTRFI